MVWGHHCLRIIYSDSSSRTVHVGFPGAGATSRVLPFAMCHVSKLAVLWGTGVRGSLQRAHLPVIFHREVYSLSRFLSHKALLGTFPMSMLDGGAHRTYRDATSSDELCFIKLTVHYPQADCRQVSSAPRARRTRRRAKRCR